MATKHHVVISVELQYRLCIFQEIIAEQIWPNKGYTVTWMVKFPSFDKNLGADPGGGPVPPFQNKLFLPNTTWKCH